MNLLRGPEAQLCWTCSRVWCLLFLRLLENTLPGVAEEFQSVCLPAGGAVRGPQGLKDTRCGSGAAVSRGRISPTRGASSGSTSFRIRRLCLRRHGGCRGASRGLGGGSHPDTCDYLLSVKTIRFRPQPFGFTAWDRLLSPAVPTLAGVSPPRRQGLLLRRSSGKVRPTSDSSFRRPSPAAKAVEVFLRLPSSVRGAELPGGRRGPPHPISPLPLPRARRKGRDGLARRINHVLQFTRHERTPSWRPRTRDAHAPGPPRWVQGRRGRGARPPAGGAAAPASARPGPDAAGGAQRCERQERQREQNAGRVSSSLETDLLLDFARRALRARENTRVSRGQVDTCVRRGCQRFLGPGAQARGCVLSGSRAVSASGRGVPWCNG